MATPPVNGEAMAQRSNSEATSFDQPLDELNECRVTCTCDSDLPLEHHDVRSTYHIYHKKEMHACISPSIDLTKERFWGCTRKESKEKKRRKKEAKALKKENPEPVELRASEVEDEGSFFLHTPYLAFHEPPRVLYVGSTKRAIPAVLIHGSFLWRKWKLQMGPSIAKDGVLDPRGVVSWRYNGGDKKILKRDDALLHGYKVRTWRLWGETGKDYVYGVKAHREAGIGPDPDVLEVEDLPNGPVVEKPSWPTRAEQVVYLEWTSPFSRDTRRYHFKFAGVDFYWKGTGTVKETRRCGWFLHFNHLKLVARLPAVGIDAYKGGPEMCLGKYTSSIATKKSGTLELLDCAIWRLMSEHMPSVLAQVQREKSLEEDDTDVEAEADRVAIVKKTLLYQLIVATAMCMIIGEKQKRATIRQIIEAAATEGAGGGGG